MTMLRVSMLIIVWHFSTSVTMNVTCSGTICQHIHINCSNNTDCYINCIDTSCYKTTIHCPQSSNICSVQCYSDGGRACEDINIDASTSQGGTLMVLASQYDNIMQNGSIICPPQGICNIVCSQAFGCQYLRIIGSYGTTLTINATNTSSFDNGYVSCPDHGQCNLNCNGIGSCATTNIDGKNSQYTNITLNAIDSFAFYKSKVWGSSYGYMDIQCDGYRSCKETLIHAHELTNYLNIYGNDEDCLRNSSIYCPNNGANKEIDCYIDAGGKANVRDTNFYAAEAFRDVTIICRSNCGYTETWTGPWIWCGTNYTHKCKLSGPSNDPWECKSGVCSTIQYTYSPTTAPTTALPTHYPTTSSPTKIPSSIPTVIPTDQPSNMPSNIPTNTPSNIPTNILTKYPTVSPSEKGLYIDTTSGHGSAENVEPETTKTVQENDSNDMVLERMGISTMTLLIILAAIIAICFIIICVIKYFRKQKQMRQLEKKSSIIDQREQGNIAIVKLPSNNDDERIDSNMPGANNESSSDSNDLFNTENKTKGEGHKYDVNGKIGERQLSRATTVASENIEELFTDHHNNDNNGITTKGTSKGGNEMENSIKNNENCHVEMDNMYTRSGRITSMAADV